MVEDGADCDPSESDPSDGISPLLESVETEYLALLVGEISEVDAKVSELSAG